MNTLTTLTATVFLATSAFSSELKAKHFVATDNTLGTQLCMAIAKNHKTTLRSTMKELRVNKNIVNKKLQCNDLKVQDFAALYSLNQSAKFLNLKFNTNTRIRDLALNNRSEALYISGSK